MNPKKPAERRQNRSTSDLGVLTGGAFQPVAPDNLLPETREIWESFFRSPLAGAVDETHLPALERLFSLIDERERAYRAIQATERIVTGSTGQPVLNPLYKLIQSFDVEIRNLEDRFGLNPKAGLSLGVQLGEAKKTLDDLNRALDDEAEEQDPRIVAIEPAADTG